MRTMLFTTLLALGLTSACKKTEEKQTVEVRKPVETETTTTTTKTVDVDVDIDKERSDLTTWVTERVNRLDAKIDALEKKGDEKSKEMAATLRAKRDQARGKMSELGQRTKDNWAEFKKDVTDAWDQLERDVDDATR
jgi:hypothetical protein